MEPILIRPAQAAEMLGISKSKIYELIASGSIPSVRLEGGRLIRVPLATLKALFSCAPENPKG
jgi:excisionase family DNA binding protein